MARIRTIKPEFPQSETMGKLSRDARLLFIMLWTICDDSGRTRAASRMLASLLFPYDDDARALLPEWLIELDKAGCIHVYEVDGQSYLEIPNWLKHQKIDRPSPSKFPEFDEASRVIVEPSRKIAQDQGREGTKERDQGPCADAPDLDAAFEMFVSAAKVHGWVEARRLEPDRRKKLAARLAEHGVDGWASMIERAAQSDFLRTEFRLKFDWVVEPKNFRKVIEGNYDNPAIAAPRMKTFDQMRRDAAATVAEEPWDQRMRGWHMKRFWHNDYGPEPGQPGCRVPPQFLVAA